MTSRKTQDALAKSTKSNVTEEVKVMTSPAGLTRAGAAEKEVAILRERVAEAPERILPILASIAGRALPALERIAEALEGIEDTLEAKPVYTGSPEHVKALLAEPVKAVAKVLDLKVVQQAFLDVLAKDREHAVRTLKGFMVERVSALPPEKFQTFVQALAGE